MNERIKIAINDSGKTKSAIAAECGVAPAAVTQWINGESKSLKPENLFALAAATGYSPRWLGIGEGPRKPAAAEANAEIIGAIDPWENSSPLHFSEVALPHYKEVEMGAGNGATEVIEEKGRFLRFSKTTLREAGVQKENAVCATVKGSSMERLILDGATIGIDTSDKSVSDGEIYAFEQDGMLRVKYMYRLPGGGVRIRSENTEEFPDEALSAEQFSQVHMFGRVFWWSTVRKKRSLRPI